MFRINTSGIITVMADKHAFGDWAIMKFIGNTMSVSGWIWTHSNKTISL